MWAPIARAQDNVFLLNGPPVRGEIVDSAKNALFVETDKGRTEIPLQNIRKLTFGKEPQEYTKALRSFEANRFDEGLIELDKLTQSTEVKMLDHEIDYLKAFGNARSALSSGNVTARDAGAAVSSFLKKFPNTHHFFEMTELLGQLLVAVGRNDLASAEFTKLTSSGLPQFELNGYFQLGQAQLLAEDGAGAEKSFDATIRSSLNDERAAKMKALAGCLRAKALLLQGRTDEAKQIVEKIIVDENPDEEYLFANAYNTLGLLHLKAGENQAAVLAYLHTDLLFSSEADAHAEALYHLATLWPKIDKNDRALETRSTLKSLYRNSVWAAKLDQ